MGQHLYQQLRHTRAHAGVNESCKVGQVSTGPSGPTPARQMQATLRWVQSPTPDGPRTFSGVAGYGRGSEPLLVGSLGTVSYKHFRAHETGLDLVCRPQLEKKKQTTKNFILYVLRLSLSLHSY